MLSAFLLAMGMLCIYGKINASCDRNQNPCVGDRNSPCQRLVSCLRDWYSLDLTDTALLSGISIEVE